MRATQPRREASAWTGSALAALIALAIAGSGADRAARLTSIAARPVKIIVGFGVGGGYDTYARMLAPYLREQLKTTVIIENQPGAGGLSALNRLYAAPPDGLQLMLISGIASTLSQLVEQGEVALRPEQGRPSRHRERLALDVARRTTVPDPDGRRRPEARTCD